MTDLVDLLTRPAPVRVELVYGVWTAGVTTIEGVPVHARATRQAAADLTGTQTVAVLRSGAADHAHLIIGTL